MKVIDASALAAVVFEEPEADRVVGLLQGASLVAPHLLRYELTNVCLTKCRRHPADRDELMRRLDRGLRFGVEAVPVDHNRVFALALETKLSAYDASYLWLAFRLDAQLVTLDERLERAWTGRAKL